jgi:hypothetical protein
MSWKTEITAFTKTKEKDLHIFPDEETVKLFILLVETENYEQMLFQLGKEYAEIALQFFQKKEYYTMCALIIRQLGEFNRVQGTNITLKA